MKKFLTILIAVAIGFQVGWYVHTRNVTVSANATTCIKAGGEYSYHREKNPLFNWEFCVAERRIDF